MKKSLIAGAVLGALAGAAVAGGVQLYGELDTGFAYTRVKQHQKDAVNMNGMKSGLLSGSHFGIKGTEDISDDLSVGFKLESSINTANGETGNGGLFFDRESSINISSNKAGTLYAGRLGVLRGSWGSVGMGNLDPLAVGNVIGGFNNVRGAYKSHVDNSLAYVSPEMAGTKVYAMYSMGKGDDQNKATTKARYAGLGAKFEQGPLTVVAVVDSFIKAKSTAAKQRVTQHTEWQANLGASYDFGAVKPIFQFSYFKNAKKFQNELGDFISLNQKKQRLAMTGIGAQLGLVAPVGSGSVITTLGYGRAVVRNNRFGQEPTKVAVAQRWNLGAAYVYNLSKRTEIYAGAGFLRSISKDIPFTAKSTYTIYQAGAGLKHAF